MEKYAWKQVAYNSNQLNPKPCPRWGHSTCIIGKEVVLFGGYACTFSIYHRIYLYERPVDF